MPNEIKQKCLYCITHDALHVSLLCPTLLLLQMASGLIKTLRLCLCHDTNLTMVEVVFHSMLCVLQKQSPPVHHRAGEPGRLLALSAAGDPPLPPGGDRKASAIPPSSSSSSSSSSSHQATCSVWREGRWDSSSCLFKYFNVTCL